MRMTEIPFGAATPVDSYAPGGFRVGGAFRAGSLLITPSWWETLEAGQVGDLTLAALASLMKHAGAFDVLLVGTGAEIARIAPETRAALEAAGLGVETMATPAACRTFNVLLAEERRVAAALIAL